MSTPLQETSSPRLSVPKHKLKFGSLTTYHKFIPNVVSGRQDSVEFKPANEIAAAFPRGVRELADGGP